MKMIQQDVDELWNEYAKGKGTLLACSDGISVKRTTEKMTKDKFYAFFAGCCKDVKKMSEAHGKKSNKCYFKTLYTE